MTYPKYLLLFYAKATGRHFSGFITVAKRKSDEGRLKQAGAGSKN